MNQTEINTVERDEASIQWTNGWVFFKSAETQQNLLPEKEHNEDWMKGFLAAMADYDLEPYREYENVYARVQSALLDKGISGHLLEMCLISVDKILGSDEWNCLPSASTHLL